jgi:hypothetical protein
MDDHRKDRDETAEILKKVFDSPGSEASEKRLSQMLAGFRQDLEAHPYLDENKKQPCFGSKKRFFLPINRLRVMLLTGTGLAIIAFVLLTVFGNKPPSWADVENRFGAIPFCSVSVYWRNHKIYKTHKIQYWMGRGGCLRIHNGYKVTFVKKDDYVRTFDVSSRQETHIDYLISTLLRYFDSVDRFERPTLKTIVEAMDGEKIVDSTSLVISNKEISKDLLVFDAESYDNLWYIRIWALRESRLPMRILKWHRNGDRYEEVLFTYSHEQPKTFFDPIVFGRALKDPAYTKYELRKLFLTDPGGSFSATPGN